MAGQLPLVECPDCHTKVESRRRCSNCGSKIPMRIQMDAQRASERANTERVRRRRISEVGRTPEGLHCPSCGGTQFRLMRSEKGKALRAIVVLPAALLAPKKVVECVTCGAR